MLPVLQQFWPLIAAGVAIAVAMVVGLMLLREGPVPYERVETLLTPAEINFLRSLE